MCLLPRDAHAPTKPKITLLWKTCTRRKKEKKKKKKKEKEKRNGKTKKKKKKNPKEPVLAPLLLSDFTNINFKYGMTVRT